MIINIDKRESYIQFKWAGKITEEEAEIKQTDWGYPPAGYGLYDFMYRQSDDVTCWKSRSSCD